MIVTYQELGQVQEAGDAEQLLWGQLAAENGFKVMADTGCGMGPETFKKIFAPFFTTKDVDGTGLGLWISAEFIERHRGKLLVRSRVSEEVRGTVFTLFMPYDAEHRSP